MGKLKGKTKPLWLVQLMGVAAALAIYLAGEMLLAVFLVKGSLPESAAFPVTVVLCFLSLFCGGLLTVRGSNVNALSSGMIMAGIFAGVLILVSLSCWDKITWTGRGGILLLCVLAGGTLAGFLGTKKRRKIKRKHR